MKNFSNIYSNSVKYNISLIYLTYVFYTIDNLKFFIFFIDIDIWGSV